MEASGECNLKSEPHSRFRKSWRGSDVYGAVVGCEGGFFDGFGEGGVGVAGAGKVFAACPKRYCCDGFGDEFAGARPDDVHSQDAVGFFMGENFYFALGLSKTQGAPVGAERKAAFLVREFFFLQVVFRFSDGGDFGIGVNDAGDGVVIHVPGSGDDVFHAGDTFLGCFVGQHRAGDDVADRVGSLRFGGEVFVDGDAAAWVEFNPGSVEAKVVCVGFAADGDQNVIGGQGRRAFAFHHGAIFLGLGAGDASIQAEFQSLFLENLAGVRCDFGVLAW
jgi:hypothetical protein